MDLRVDLIGVPRMLRGGRSVEIPGSRKTRALLGYLLLQDRPVSRESLCETFWPVPDDPRAALRWSLSKLRPLFVDIETPSGPAWAVDRRAVQLRGIEDCVDARQLLSLDLSGATTAELEESCEGWIGDLLDGHELPDCHRFHDWLLIERERLRRARIAVLEELVRRHRPDHDRAMLYAHQLHSLDPGHDLYEQTKREAMASAARRDFRDSPAGSLPLAVATSSSSPWFDEMPSAPSARGSAGLFGRVEEARALEEMIHSLEQGRAAPVLLFEGEPGIGKTRLIEELQRRASSSELRVLTARSWEAEMIRPYGPWQDLLDSADSELLDEDHRAALAALLPGATTTETLDEARLFRRVTGWVESLVADTDGLVLAFDDLQWMDAASAALLHYVSRHAGHRVGIVCTGRSGELSEEGPVRAVLRAWSRDGRLQRVSVGSLRAEDAAALARSLAPDVDVTRAVERCGGNPLYLIECCRALDQPLPTAVQQLLRDRIETLSPVARAFARWVAVLGRVATVEWMEEVSDVEPRSLRLGAAELREKGILVLSGGRCDFAHDLMRQTVYAALGSFERNSLHSRVADALSKRSIESEELTVDLAYHASKAEQWDLAARAGLRASERALRLAARDDARDLAKRALRDLSNESLDAPALSVGAQLYRVLVHAGLGRRDAVWLKERLESLVVDARRLGNASAERMAFYLLSILSEESGDFRGAQAHTLAAEAIGRDADDHTRLAALSNTSRCLLQLEREPRRARRLLEEAEGLAGEMEESVLDLPWARGLLGVLEQEPERARRALESGADQARQAENHWAHFECLIALSKLDLEDGEHESLAERHRELIDVARRLGDGTEQVFAESILALANRKRSRSSADDDALELALSRLRDADTKGRLAYALNTAAEMDLGSDNCSRARSRASPARAAAGAVGRPMQPARARALLGLAALRGGDRITAREQAEQLEMELREWGGHAAARAQLLRLRSALVEVEKSESPRGSDSRREPPST